MKSSWGWRWDVLSTWPAPLETGANPRWQGWSTPPDLKGVWPEDFRRVVLDALDHQYRAANLEPPSTLDAVRDSRCRTVTVGHQLVLAGGPAFFHHKILSAIRTARLLSDREKRPVVPVFWMASEDHDWKEISVVFGKDGPHAWTPHDSEIPHPVGSRSLDGVTAILEAWASDGAPSEEVNALVSACSAASEAGESLAGVFRRWLHRWYGAEGLLVLDGNDASLKACASFLWEAELEGRGVHAALAGTHHSEGPAFVRENNVFWMDENQGRVGMVSGEETGSWKAGSWQVERPEDGWSTWSKDHAVQCSPGVLLRPLYQETLLHSVAVVVGPGEWKYWSQLPAAFDHHALTFPALRLRDHGVVLNSDTMAAGWDLADGWMHDEDWDRWILNRWMAIHQDELEALSSEMDLWLRKVDAWASSSLTGASALSGAFESGVQKEWAQWLKKIRRVLKGQRAEEWAQARRACESLVRRGVPQDRWANWHVLAGSVDEVERWKDAWLNPAAGLEARVWRFGPLEGNSGVPD